MAKAKRMTQAEKKWRAELRAEMRAEGILPPKKKPLNRKKFIEDAEADFGKTMTSVFDLRYLVTAATMVMLAHKTTLEGVGAAKVLKVACENKRFEEELQASGRDSFQYGELYDRLKPIIRA